MSVSGDTAVIGANLADVGGNWYQGAAYAFYRNLGGADAWGQVAKLTAADGAGGDWFGDSVSVSGDTALVGAYAASGPRPVQGAAYVHALPPGAADDEYSTPEDTLLETTAGPGVLDNDADPDGASLTAVLDAGPAHGTLDLRPDGSFTYSPAANWNGVDAFTYHANNGMYNSDPATVTIAVTPVNDAPIAVNDVYGTREELAFGLDQAGRAPQRHRYRERSAHGCPGHDSVAWRAIFEGGRLLHLHAHNRLGWGGHLLVSRDRWCGRLQHGHGEDHSLRPCCLSAVGAAC